MRARHAATFLAGALLVAVSSGCTITVESNAVATEPSPTVVAPNTWHCFVKGKIDTDNSILLDSEDCPTVEYRTRDMTVYDSIEISHEYEFVVQPKSGFDQYVRLIEFTAIG